MISIFVAYILFWASTIAGLLIIVYELWPKSKADKALDRLLAYQNGYTMTYDWRKLSALFVVWIVSGIYLWG